MENKYIPLNAFLKIKGIASTGGQAKRIIRQGNVKVNGKIDLRVTKKLKVGDKVEVGKHLYEVKEEIIE